ncbi:MAG: 2-C-methyl-D-erythritol 4-phosphate cytidylyltransferase [Oscillospiraceae bacterium]|nr:2-C-methyl-D-erythritol 4-phosphate cytidylyltransferase [Oscillospiraceae bacterium]
MKQIVNLLGAAAKRLLPPRCSAVLVAAGSASRMGGVDKVMAELSGKPMILRAAEAFQACPAVQELVVVTREDLKADVEELLRDAGVTKLTHVVAGGGTRQESVQNGLFWCDRKSKLIAIHDAARPLVSQQVILDAISAAARTGAAAPGIPVRDTVRVVEQGIGVSTPRRETLYAIQTPQVFDADLIRAAIQRAVEKGLPGTDDCAAMEAMGMKVTVTAGSEENFKVTTRMDLALASALARRRDLA